jgi:hypothetical protein
MWYVKELSSKIKKLWSWVGKDENNRAIISIGTVGILIATIIIGTNQNSINEQLLNLNYNPSILIDYIPGDTNASTSAQLFGKWHILNKSKEKIFIKNILFSDTELPDFLRDKKVFFLNGVGKSIAPDASENFNAPNADAFIKKSREKIGPDGGAQIEFEVYVETADGKRDTILCVFSITVQSGKVKIDTSVISS